MVAAAPVSIQSPAGIQMIRAHSPATSGTVWKENGPMDRMGRIVPFNRGSELYRQLEPANYLYQLISGVAQAYRLTADGHRQIVAFYLPGDLFGFEVGSGGLAKFHSCRSPWDLGRLTEKRIFDLHQTTCRSKVTKILGGEAHTRGALSDV